MTYATALPMLRLALSALDRDVPNVEMARGLLREILGTQQEPEAPKAAAASRALPYSEAAAALGYSAKHVRALAKAGRIPTIGSGRSARVLMDEAVEALRSKGRERDATTNADAIESAGAAYVRRGRLRAV